MSLFVESFNCIWFASVLKGPCLSSVLDFCSLVMAISFINLGLTLTSISLTNLLVTFGEPFGLCLFNKYSCHL